MIKNLLQPSKIIALNDGQPEVFGHQMQGKCTVLKDLRANMIGKARLLPILGVRSYFNSNMEPRDENNTGLIILITDTYKSKITQLNRSSSGHGREFALEKYDSSFLTTQKLK